MGGDEYQPPAASKIKRELSGAVTLERVGVAGDELGDTRCSFQRQQAYFQLPRTGCAKFLFCDGLFFTQVADFLAFVANLQEAPILAFFTYLVNFNIIDNVGKGFHQRVHLFPERSAFGLPLL